MMDRKEVEISFTTEESNLIVEIYEEYGKSEDELLVIAVDELQKHSKLNVDISSVVILFNIFALGKTYSILSISHYLTDKLSSIKSKFAQAYKELKEVAEDEEI